MQLTKSALSFGGIHYFSFSQGLRLFYSVCRWFREKYSPRFPNGSSALATDAGCCVRNHLVVHCMPMRSDGPHPHRPDAVRTPAPVSYVRLPGSDRLSVDLADIVDGRRRYFARFTDRLVAPTGSTNTSVRFEQYVGSSDLSG
jgi:hypothetical protein